MTNDRRRRTPFVYHIDGIGGSSGSPAETPDALPDDGFREDLMTVDPPRRFGLFDLSTYDPDEAEEWVASGPQPIDAIAFGLEYDDRVLVAFRNLWNGEWLPSVHASAEQAREYYSQWGPLHFAYV